MQQPARPRADGLAVREQPSCGGIDAAAVQGQPDHGAPEQQVLGREHAQAAQRAAASLARGLQP
eukprot:12002104-Alexandrium_andersonii.AAC.1